MQARRFIILAGCVFSLIGITLLVRKSAESRRSARDQALVQAVIEGDWEQTAALLQAGASVHTRTLQGESLLFTADAERNPELVSALAQRGLSLHERDAMGLTVLHRAARRGDVEMLETLLKLGQPVDELDARGRSALNHALRGAHYDATHLLLESGANAHLPSLGEPPLLSLLSAGFTPKADSRIPFEVAGGIGSSGPGPLTSRSSDPLARYRPHHLQRIHDEAPYLACVRELLAYGATPNARDAKGNSPVEVAISRECWKTVRVLVEKLGSWRDAEGRTALRVAAELGSSAGVGELYQIRKRPSEGGKAELVLVAWAGDTRRIAALLRAGLNPNESGIPGRTALTRAAERGDLDNVNALLAAGARPEQHEFSGVTPLHVAALKHHLPTVQALLSAGAPVNLPSELGRTPLHEASSSTFRQPGSTAPSEITQDRAMQQAVVRLLLQHDADPNARDHQGVTPLQTALMQYGRPLDGTIVRLLLEHGSSVSGSGTAEAPLFTAAREGDISLAKALLERGAKINERNHEGATPLWTAAMYNQRGIMRFLCAHGAQLPELPQCSQRLTQSGSSELKPLRVADVVRHWPPTDERRLILAAQFPALAAEINAPRSEAVEHVSPELRR